MAKAEVLGGSYAVECLIVAKQRPVDKCKLCGRVDELCDSHYLPKRLYAFLRAAQLQNPNLSCKWLASSSKYQSSTVGYVDCGRLRRAEAPLFHVTAPPLLTHLRCDFVPEWPREEWPPPCDLEECGALNFGAEKRFGLGECCVEEPC